MIYDVIIIWAWASGLFSWICLDKKLKKIILEKTNIPWNKVLLSWGGRANVTNMNIDLDSSYFSQNKKFLKSIFSKYSNWDFISFCSENWINLVEEDRWRLFLESSNSREIVDLFLRKIKEYNCEMKLNSEVVGIEKKDEIFEIKLLDWKIFKSKNIIISSGWKSFSHIWTSWDWYNFAEEFWIKLIPTFSWLCWLSIKNDLSDLSWIGCNAKLNFIDNKNKKNIYSENWPLLFTHFGLSWPIIFNTSVAIWEYLANIYDEKEKYLSDNLIIELEFNLENLPKKIIKFFELEKQEKNNKIILELHSLRSLKEAKITTGWIDLDELDNNMQSKKQKGLFFVWEVVDVTWKTWGFNLQWAWSSSYIACDFINSKYNKKI